MCQIWTKEDQERFDYFFQSGVIEKKSHIMRYLGIAIGKILLGGEFDWEKEFQCIFLLPVMFQNCIDWNKFFMREKVAFSFKGVEYSLQIREPEKKPKTIEQELNEISIFDFDMICSFSPEFPQGKVIGTIFPDMKGMKKKTEKEAADLEKFLQPVLQKLGITLNKIDYMYLNCHDGRAYLSSERDAAYLIIENGTLVLYKYVGEPIFKMP